MAPLLWMILETFGVFSLQINKVVRLSFIAENNCGGQKHRYSLPCVLFKCFVLVRQVPQPTEHQPKQIKVRP